MSLPVRPPATPQNPSPDTLNTLSSSQSSSHPALNPIYTSHTSTSKSSHNTKTTPVHDATSAVVTQASCTPAINQATPTTPDTKIIMCGSVDSSPFSSPTSSIQTPPGLFRNTASAMQANDTSVADLKASPAPAPGTPKSTTSNTSKKRTRANFDEDAPVDTDKAPKQRKKAAAPKKSATPRKPAAKKTPAAAPTTTRPTRDRRAPQRLVDAPTPPKKPAARRQPAAGPRTWHPQFVTESHRSRLLKVDVYHMLLHDSAWSGLSVAQQRELFTLLPKTTTNERLLGEMTRGVGSARPLELQLNCSEFRVDVAAYLEELGEGYWSRAWQEAAKVAVGKRERGEYDEWKEEESEAWWGQKATSE